MKKAHRRGEISNRLLVLIVFAADVAASKSVSANFSNFLKNFALFPEVNWSMFEVTFDRDFLKLVCCLSSICFCILPLFLVV